MGKRARQVDFDEICARQAAVFSRQQAMRCGLTVEDIRAQVRSGRWRRVHRGVYATFTGTLPRDAQLWAVVLGAGRGATLSHVTAAELYGLVDHAAPAIHVSIPPDRRVNPTDGVVIHVATNIEAVRHPTRLPPQTRVEHTVLDLTQSARSLDEAIAWLAKACSRRLTTAARLVDAFAGRTRLRWRAELVAALRDVAAGCHCLLELRYLREVERRHGLPVGVRQRARRRPGGRWYDDVAYLEFHTRVELDGAVAHPDEARSRDLRRDNAAAVGGDTVLRYGYAQVTAEACAVAGEVARVLHRNGWPGMPRRCGPQCGLR
jgi:very-short-patch-repair endonuclease